MANGFDVADSSAKASITKKPEVKGTPMQKDHHGSTAAFAMQETFAKIQAKILSAEQRLKLEREKPEEPTYEADPIVEESAEARKTPIVRSNQSD